MKIEVLDRLERNIKDPRLLEDLGVQAVSLVQKNIKEGPWESNSSLTQEVKQNNKPLQDRGKLLSSITYKTYGSYIEVGTNHVAAKILHDGGVIRPKSSKFLAIPASRESRKFMRAYGATPRACISGMEAAGYKVWFAKNMILAQRENGRKTYALFVLKRSIKIPARPFLELPDQSVKILPRSVMRRLLR